MSGTNHPIAEQTSIEAAVGNTLQATQGAEGLFAIIPVTVSSPSPFRTVQTLKTVTSKGDDVTGNRKVHNSTVEMFDPTEIAFGKRIRDNVRALFREHGYNLGNGLFLVAASKLEFIYKEIINYLREYDSEVMTFLDNYPDLIQKQILLNPKLKAEVEKHHPSIEAMKSSFQFRIGAPQAVQIHSSFNSVTDLLKTEGVEINSGMIEPIISSLASDMKHFWNYNIRTIRRAMEDKNYRDSFSNPHNRRTGVKGVFLSVLKNMRNKTQDAEKLDGRLAMVTAEFDAMIDSIPDKDIIKDTHLYTNYDVAVRVNEFASRMCESEYLTGLINTSKDVNGTEDDAVAIAKLTEQYQEEASQSAEQEVSLEGLLFGCSESQVDVNADLSNKDGEVDLNALLSGTEGPVETKVETKPNELTVDSVTVETGSVKFNASNVEIDELAVTTEQINDETIQTQEQVEEEAEPQLQTTAKLAGEVDLKELFSTF
ncbi:DUF3150 domain-containing protein [Vibrio sp. Makdt]|uniref:DUF3150 domain-containing protein n=1 Tax=Vibrio sp. Makdt TaxID=2998828 RepID=UPI0022CD91E4|nr:DUF3150 domain-containing protein [Vibrio sp. Makdt]MDA0152394.1 DUF3150 domain-containing protein [Vibrio sp. Makdt]